MQVFNKGKYLQENGTRSSALRTNKQEIPAENNIANLPFVRFVHS